MLRVKIIQESAHFRIPTIGNPYLSYPLPPPATIYGFLREITDKESINFSNTRLAIQGKYNGISLEKEQLNLTTSKESKTNIINIQKIHLLELILHIQSENYEKKIIDGVNNYKGALRLGRREDLIIDIETAIVSREFENTKDALDDDMFIFMNLDKKLKGNIFNVSLDTLVDDELKIIGRKYINLLYLSIFDIPYDMLKFDGEYSYKFIKYESK